MSEPRFRHVPVLLTEVVAAAPAHCSQMLDCTLGGAGHSRALLERFPEARLYGIDRDATALLAARHRLRTFAERCHLAQASFVDLADWIPHWEATFDFILADLGMSSEQLSDPERGFSFLLEGPLDMRMDPEHQVETAAQLLRSRGEFELRRIFQEYGEERFAPQIARAIVQRRGQAPLTTTLELATLVEQTIPRRFHKPHFHPATQTFQALRMEINREPEQIEALLQTALTCLRPAGRLAIISFHSLEDRPVKQAFRAWEHPCHCPPELPQCVCGLQALGYSLQRKPILAQAEETRDNPRSRSAKLRVFVRNEQPLPPTLATSKD